MDADCVWRRDPIPFLIQQQQQQQQQKWDLLAMDDGARSLRFSPLFLNSGFLLLKVSPKMVVVVFKKFK